ncbi:MAG TPA: hypothetical protein ENL00_00830, partial [Nitratifractor sp.]|nr:hypothetical protein [Nitratifractor sp.]
MSDILIIGQGKVAASFVQKVASKEHLEHQYTLLTAEEPYQIKDNRNERSVTFDPTSLFRLKQSCFDNKYKSVFIIYEDMKEAKAIYCNLREFN